MRLNLSKGRLFASAIFLFSCVVGLLVMIGWVFQASAIVQIIPTFVPMQFNTALCFFLIGLAGVLRILGWRYFVYIPIGIVLFFTVLTLFEYLFTLNFGIDEFFIRHTITVKTTHPGRMSPGTAINFVFSASALILYSLEKLEEKWWFAASFAIAVFFLGLLADLYYVFGVNIFFHWQGLTEMAMHTSFTFTLLGIGLFFLCTPSKIWKQLDSLYMAMPVLVIVLLVLLNVWFAIVVNNLKIFGEAREAQYSLTMLSALLIIIIFLFMRTLNKQNLLGKLNALQNKNAEVISHQTNMLRCINHEFKNQLQGILGFAQIIQSEAKGKNDAICEYAEHIEVSLDRMQMLIYDLLYRQKDYEKALTLNEEELDFGDWIDGLLTRMEKRARLEGRAFSLKAEPPMPKRVKFDIIKLEQIVNNLVFNAFRHSPAGASVDVQIKAIRQAQDQASLWFAVEDHGEGIAPEIKKNLFVAYQRGIQPSGGSGIGLGLSICKMYVDLMKGKMDVMSEVGKGSTFTFSIPIKVLIW